MTDDSHKGGNKVSSALVVGALGVVYGDIGTSPLYALRESLSDWEVTPANIYGVLSLIFWSLTIIISLKYLVLVLRADNRGEGGVLALNALLHGHDSNEKTRRAVILSSLGIFGACLLYGDGVLTPAISVLSAVEGLKVVTPLFEPYIVPTTVCILLLLFLIQSRGTDKIGSLFGPIIFIWFSTIGILGLSSILDNPVVLKALNPGYAVSFFFIHGWHAFLTLGAVFLCVTGGEALYADMGHFGRKPIQYGWFFVAFPGLLLNYFGQGALLLSNPSALSNPFYLLAPEWALLPLVILATVATVIASQALISGAFSITSQAIQFGLLPRLTIRHTSSEEIGQIYISRVNWLLLALTIWVVLEFQSSSNLASAYGIAVSTSMVITTILIFCVSRQVWKWPFALSASICTCFFVVDFIFFASNFLKVADGGWMPLLLAFVILTLMLTWKRGRYILRQRLLEKLPPFDVFVHDIPEMTPVRVPGTAVYMNTYSDLTPPALLHNLKHNKVIHELILICNVVLENVPYVSPVRRVEVSPVGRSIYKVEVHYGYMDKPDIPRALTLCKTRGLGFDPKTATFFFGRETILATDRPGMAIWREELFSFLSRNAQKASRFFGIRADQVVEIGFEIEM